MSSDTIVRSSSESEKKSREKYDEESVSSEKKPRMQHVESSSDTESDAPSTPTEKRSKSVRSLGKKIKKAWKNVKEKFTDNSSHTPKTKKSTPFKFKAVDPSLPEAEKIDLWKKNGQNLFENIENLTSDFEKSQKVITNLILTGGENAAADEFNAEDYAGLAFDFSATMSDGALINPMQIFGSKPVITSTKTTAEELLANSDEESTTNAAEELLVSRKYVPSGSIYALNKPIKLCARGIGSALFSNQLLNILREIPLTCPVILDVSSNNLGPYELAELAYFMMKHPVIYSLDIGDNPIGVNNDICFAFILLFGVLRYLPLSQLYLDKTGLNDIDALSLQGCLKSTNCLRHLNLQHNKLTEKGISEVIDSVIPLDYLDRRQDDSALTMVQMQHNSPNDWDPIVVAINEAFKRTRIGDKNIEQTLTAIPLQIDIPDPWIKKLSFAEPYISEITRPQNNSADAYL
jgi:hypothetical protein